MVKSAKGSQKILIVEDYAVLARMYQDKLRSDGFEVEVAVDGEQGENLVRQFNPDLVLLDVMLPKKNGLEILESIKSDPKTAATSVIMLTNLGGPPETIARALELGADNYLVKANYTPKQVIEEVKKVLRKRVEAPIQVPAAPGVEQAPAVEKPVVPPLPPPAEKPAESVKEDQRETAREDLRKAAMLLEMAQKQAGEAAKKLTELSEGK